MKKTLTATMVAMGLLGSSLVSTQVLADTKLTLVEVITSPDRTRLLEKRVAEFEAQNQGVDVEVISLPWGQAFEKLATMVASGQVPDVIEMPDAWQALYTSSGMLENLDPYLAEWEHTNNLTDSALDMARHGSDNAHLVPYGFYLRAMFWNKKLFEQAGLNAAPKTMSEFKDAAKKISALGDDISGYCMRGGVGGTNAWLMFMAANKGSADLFDGKGNSLLVQDDAVGGAKFLIDMYQDGYAPKDSVNWGFNEIVSGFYSGKCAMLDQDPDALIAVAKNMDENDFAVAPMPVGPSGKAFPTIGYVGWSMFKSSSHKELGWDLISHLSSPESNLEWSKFVGVLPVFKGADKDPYYSTEQYSGWFQQLNNSAYQPMVVPSHLKEWGYFNSVLVKETSQEALLGQRDVKDMTQEWADYLSKAQKKYLDK